LRERSLIFDQSLLQTQNERKMDLSHIYNKIGPIPHLTKTNEEQQKKTNKHERRTTKKKTKSRIHRSISIQFNPSIMHHFLPFS